MTRQFLAIPAASATAERVFSFWSQSLPEGTLEAIMWTKWESPNIPYLHITHTLTLTFVTRFHSVSATVSIDFLTFECPESKFQSPCVRVSELVVRTEFIDTTINYCQTG